MESENKYIKDNLMSFDSSDLANRHKEALLEVQQIHKEQMKNSPKRLLTKSGTNQILSKSLKVNKRPILFVSEKIISKTVMHKKISSTDPPQELLPNNIKRIKGPTKQIFKTVKCKENKYSKDFLKHSHSHNKKELTVPVIKQVQNKAAAVIERYHSFKRDSCFYNIFRYEKVPGHMISS